MPAIRDMWMVHPVTDVPGLWVSLTADAPGTIRGLAQSSFPARGGRTAAQYGALLTTTLQAVGLTNVVATVRIITLTPLRVELVLE